MWGGYAAMLCAQELSIPYVVTEHASSVMQNRLSAKNRALITEVYRNAAAVIAVSQALRRSIGDAMVIPNCVDANFFRPPRTERATTPFVFLFVGDLVRSKRIDLLLGAFGTSPRSSSLETGHRRRR